MQKHVSARETIGSDGFLSRLVRQGHNYAKLVGWLLYRSFHGRTWKLVIATTLSLLHLSSQGAAIYVVYWYGRQMGKPGPITVPLVHFQVSLKDHPELLWAVVAASTTLFVISAALLYSSRRQIIDVVQEHYARSLEQLVFLSLRVPDPRAPIASRIFLDHGLTGLTTGCRRGTLTATSFASAVTALVGGLGAAFFLFRIDLPLTLLIVVAAVLGALFLYPLTLRAAKNAKDRDKAQLVLKTEIRKLNEDLSVEPTTTSLESVDEVSRVYMMRRRVLTEVIFATEIGITVILGVVIYYMASQALAGREQWAIFIAYIGALRLTLNGAAQAVRAFASVSRYYPQIVRYYLFVKDMQQVDQTPLAKMAPGDRVVLGPLPNGQEAVAEVGDLSALLTLGQLREPMFALAGAKLAHSGEPIASAFVDPGNIRENGSGLALIPFLKLGKVEHPPELFTDRLKDKVTFVVYHQAEKAASCGEKYVLSIEDNELRRFALLGTEEGDAVLKEFSLRAAAKLAAKGGLPDDDDDEDEDM